MGRVAGEMNPVSLILPTDQGASRIGVLQKALERVSNGEAEGVITPEEKEAFEAVIAQLIQLECLRAAENSG